MGEYKNIQVREANRLLIEDGEVELSRIHYHRYYCYPPDADEKADSTSRCDKPMADIFWTDEIKAAYQESLENLIV